MSTGSRPDKPRLIYTKQTAIRDPRLTGFLDTIRAEGVVSYRSFKDAAELGSLVADDLAVLLTDRFASAATRSPHPAAAAPPPAARGDRGPAGGGRRPGRGREPARAAFRTASGTRRAAPGGRSPAARVPASRVPACTAQAADRPG